MMDRTLQQARESFAAGDRARAEELCQQVLAHAPGDPEALHLLGILRLQGGRAAAAIPLLEEALRGDPGNLSALDALSAALMVVGDAARAEAVVRRALAVDADLPVAHMRLGMVLSAQGRWAEAAGAFAEAIQHDPEFAEAHHNLGDALMKLGRVSEAVTCLHQALAIDPGNPDTHNSLGVALQDFLQWNEAIKRFERALELNPGFADARYNLGVACLFRHEFERGWAGHEHRLECKDTRRRLRLDPASVSLYENLPRWRGPGEAGVEEVAIWAEQGIGDQILFSTLIPELIGAGVPFRYEVDTRLLAAYRRAFPGTPFAPFADPPREEMQRASRVLLAGSLPGLFRRSRADFARQPAKLLSALPERVAHYRQRLDALGPGLKVALAWSSKREDWWAERKNAPLTDFIPLLKLPGVRFVDVQYGDTAAERGAVEAAAGVRLTRFHEVDYFNDLEELFALLEACDLLIATSNATAHFAGALGKRTWLLYPGDNPPFHYWAHGGSYRSIWYPSVEILSGRALTDWPALFEHAAARLAKETRVGGMEPHGPEGRGSSGGRSAAADGSRARPEGEGMPQGSADEARRWSDLAYALRWDGKLEEARQAASRAIELEPSLASAWFNLGAVHVAQDEISRGIEAYRRALEFKPDFAEAWSNLGEALAAQGDRPAGIEAYRRAIGINPQLAPVWSNLGNALLDAGKLEEAVTAYRRATGLAPDFAAGWSNLGNALRECGKYDEAVHACERGVDLAPHSAEAWTNLGSALLERGETEKSLAAHRRALEINPGMAAAHYNLGIALERGRQYELAAGSYRRAVEIAPVFPAARMRLACVLLMRGDLAAGWPEYECRWQDKNARPKRFDFTPWAGDLSPGRRLLAWGEQGVGDEIIYASMVGELADAGLRVTLETDPRLADLMRRSFPRVAVVARSDPPAIDPADFDFQSPLASLGRWLRPAFDRFPRHGGYLKADAGRANQYCARLRRSGPGIVVGISWSSSNQEFGAHKSSALADWAGLLTMPGARFVDLQYGDTAAARGELRRCHGVELTHLDDVDLFNDLEALAALCAACDLVITVSNVTAHMAGALGKPAWLLAPAANGRLWYWFSGREDSPWYPSMRIFTQPSRGDWGSVLDAVTRELGAFIGRMR